MKKIVCMISFVLCLTFICSNTAFASALTPEFDYNKIAEADRSEIEQLMNSDEVMDIVNPGSNPDRDLQWGTPYIRYIDTDILTLDSSSKSDIMETLEAGDYCYEITIFKEGLEIALTFDKGRAPKEGIEDILTEEEYQEVVDNAGKWMLNSYGYVEESDMSYYRAIQEYGLTEENDFIIVASQPGLEYPVIVEFVDDAAEYIYPIYGVRTYPLLTDEENRATLSVNENGAYSYDEVAALAVDYKQAFMTDTEEDGVNKPLIYLLVCIAIFIFLILIPGILRKRDFKRQVIGKLPERELPNNYKISYDKEDDSKSGTDAIGAAGEINARRGWFHPRL